MLKTIAVAELRQNLAATLETVAAGDAVLVCRRGKIPMALLVPIDAACRYLERQADEIRALAEGRVGVMAGGSVPRSTEPSWPVGASTGLDVPEQAMNAITDRVHDFLLRGVPCETLVGALVRSYGELGITNKMAEGIVRNVHEGMGTS